MAEFAQISLFRPFLLCALTSLAAFHWGVYRNHDSFSWLAEVGAIALLVAEFGAMLTRDYYFYRRHRGDSKSATTLTAQIEPPQLLLKGAWGSYLLAFGVALFVSISLLEKAWLLILLSFGIFFLAYYEGAPPFFWRRTRWASFLTALAGSWFPFFIGEIVSWKHETTVSDFAVIGAIYLVRVTLSWNDTLLR